MRAIPFLEFRLAPVAAALLAAFGSAYGAEGDLRSKITPDSSIEVGAGYVDSDNGNFGKYNGLNEQGGYLLLDGDIRTLDEASGTRTRLKARSLGLDSRELRWDFTRQGNYGYYFEYNALPRFEPLNVTSPVLGIGGPALSLGATPANVDLESKRQRYSLGFDKSLTGNWGFNVDFRNETKKGERIFGMGSATAGDFVFTPEPFDSVTRLLEATARYSGAKFHLVGGYYGTEYRNDLNTLTQNYGAGAGTMTLNPLVLPPDNHSHQLYVMGGYAFTPTTQGTFKVAYSVAKQNDSYVEPTAVTANGRTDLGGEVETTLLQAGISARPMAKLSITGNLRYEDRNDDTPIVQYFTPGTTSSGFNEPRSLTNTSAKLDASYALPHGFRAIGALEYDKRERNTYAIRAVAHRDETEEMSYRAELRRAMSETVTGAVSYTYSERDGSPWYPSTVVGLVTPTHYADRNRDKVRVSANWMPAAPLSLQFYVDDISDRYNSYFPFNGVGPAGPQKSDQQVYTIDAAYQFKKDWHLTAWYSYNEYKYQNVTGQFADTSTNEADSYGVGVRGKPNSRVELGADYTYTDIQDDWQQTPLPGVAPLAAQLPVAVTRLTRLKLYGKYMLDKKSALRLDYIYDRYSSNDPTWTGWVNPASAGYRDGTVLSQGSPQTVNFVGVRYIYNFR